MLCTNALARTQTARRPAFTLIELLVIVAILAALAALTAGAYLRFIGVQQQNNTRAALNKIQPVLDKGISAVKDKALKETIPPATLSYILQNLSGSADANYMDRARVIYVKLRVRQVFPETFSEVFTPVPGMGMQTYVNKLAQYGINSTNAGNQYQYQSGVCLAMALETDLGSGGIKMEDLGKGGALATVPVDPGAGSPSAPAFIDAWGTPICFCRFPAGSPIRNPSGAQQGRNDPLDPLGYLNSGSWPGNCQTNYQALLLQRLAGQNNASFNLWPIVASAGPDKQFGLWMSPAANNAGSGYFDFSVIGPQANDNLYPGS